MIEFACTHCGKQLRVKDEASGKKGKCPQCGNMVEVPSAATEVHLAEIDAPIQPVRRQQAPPVVQPPPLERGHVAQAPSVNVHMPKRSSSLGIVSLILGVVAFLICWIPLIGVVSIPVSALGVLLAAQALDGQLVVAQSRDWPWRSASPRLPASEGPLRLFAKVASTRIARSRRLSLLVLRAI